MQSETNRLEARSIVRDAARRLSEAGVPEARASAEILLSELLGIKRGDIPFHRISLTDAQSATYEANILRRLKREPVQRILGYAYFRNLKLDLSQETLVPRPDTESVVDAALKLIDSRPEPPTVLDIGTGTGAIAISISQERPACTVHASDVNDDALQTASLNSEKNSASVEFHHSNLVESLKELIGKTDLLVSNPPYVEREVLEMLEPEVRNHDPRIALDGGADGLYFYRRILTEAKPLLKPGADVVFEVGDDQADDVLRLGTEAGYDAVGTHEDLAGSVRAVTLRWKG